MPVVLSLALGLALAQDLAHTGALDLAHTGALDLAHTGMDLAHTGAPDLAHTLGTMEEAVGQAMAHTGLGVLGSGSYWGSYAYYSASEEEGRGGKKG